MRRMQQPHDGKRVVSNGGAVSEKKSINHSEGKKGSQIDRRESYQVREFHIIGQRPSAGRRGEFLQRLTVLIPPGGRRARRAWP